MIDVIINKHIDRMDKIEDRFEKDLEGIFSSMNVDEIMADPEGAMLAVVEIIKERVEDEYAKEAINEGIRFAETLEDSGRDIVIQDTDDPNLNEDIVND